jgi:dihydrofolate synthase/folylpolyglutamate synthase
MDHATLLHRLSRRGLFRIKPGLERVQAVSAALGQPQNQVPVIHIAGTNGKGSVAACLESILRHAGYTTGLYTSPHLKDVRERIQFNRNPISRTLFARLAKQVMQAEQNSGVTLTYFEFQTLMAYLAFAQANVDVAVVETGMGGRWDATNIVSHPILTVITSIGLDHRQWLGKTEPLIAHEKAGIIKPSSPLVSGARGAAGLVITQSARRHQVPFQQIDIDFEAKAVAVDWHQARQFIQTRTASGEGNISIPLLGRYQIDNAAIVMTGVEFLRQHKWSIPEQAVRSGFANVDWPGRFQVVWKQDEPRWLLDGAHNPPAMQRFLETLQESPWRDRPKTFVFGVYRDKDYRTMLRMIRPTADRFIFCTLPGPRALPAREAARSIKGVPYKIIGDPHKALKTALQSFKSGELVIVTGSLALVGMLAPQTKPARTQERSHV